MFQEILQGSGGSMAEWEFLGEGTGVSGNVILSNYSATKYKEFLYIGKATGKATEGWMNPSIIPKSLLDNIMTIVTNAQNGSTLKQFWIKIQDDNLYACTWSQDNSMEKCVVYAR